MYHCPVCGYTAKSAAGHRRRAQQVHDDIKAYERRLAHDAKELQRLQTATKRLEK